MQTVCIFSVICGCRFPDRLIDWLKAFRRAEEDVEYLEILKKKLGMTDADMERFIDHYLGQKEGKRWRTVTDPEKFRRLREATALLIEKSSDAVVKVF